MYQISEQDRSLTVASEHLRALSAATNERDYAKAILSVMDESLPAVEAYSTRMGQAVRAALRRQMALRAVQMAWRPSL